MTRAGWIAAMVAAPLVGVLIGAGVVLLALDAPTPKAPPLDVPASASAAPRPEFLVLSQETYGCASVAIFADILLRPDNKSASGAPLALMRAVLQGHCAALVKGERVEVAGPVAGPFRPVRFNGRELFVVRTMVVAAEPAPVTRSALPK